MKRLAICLFGMSYRDPKPHWGGAVYSIDARPCKYNHDKYIASYFKNIGYEIDYYLSTNESEKSEWFKTQYNPVYANFDDQNNENSDRVNVGRQVRNSRLLNVLNGCFQSGIEYDMVIAMRFDMLICKTLDTWSIDFDHFNVMSFLERPKRKLIDDNIYVFNGRCLNAFIKVICQNVNKNHHELYHAFAKEFQINLMYNECARVDHLTSFKILRTLPDGTTYISMNNKNVAINVNQI